MTPVDGDSLVRLVEGARSGDAAASRELVEALYPQVIRIVRGHRPRQETEEDLAQEVFLKILTRLDRYEVRSGVPFTHWVSRLAVRTCLDRLRSERRRPEIPCTDLSPEDSQWIEYLAGGGECPQDATPGVADFSAVELVGRLLSRLSPDDRCVIQWLDLDRKSVREVSELTGWSRPAVKVRAFRARHRLRKVAEAFRTEADP
ncbi:MAG: sigma-70 family RNA polymerase sigma factor [Verrucomicrobiales bacterium]|nr:sigma-70 family RNA polymerase sigma factor [Verrucomicrobiales bacterium]